MKRKIKIISSLLLFVFFFVFFGSFNELKNNEITKEIKEFNKYKKFYTKEIKNDTIIFKIIFYARKYNLPNEDLFPLIKNESYFCSEAIGCNYDSENNILSYDLGIMQLNTFSFHLKNWKDIDENLDNGCQYLAECMKIGNNKFACALYIYNAGEWAYIHNRISEITYNYIGKVLEEKSRLFEI